MTDAIPERLRQELSRKGFTNIQFDPEVTHRSQVFRIDGGDHPGMMATVQKWNGTVTVHELGNIHDLMTKHYKRRTVSGNFGCPKLVSCNCCEPATS